MFGIIAYVAFVHFCCCVSGGFFRKLTEDDLQTDENYTVTSAYKVGSLIQCATYSHRQEDTLGFGFNSQIPNSDDQPNCNTWKTGTNPGNNIGMWTNFENYIKVSESSETSTVTTAITTGLDTEGTQTLLTIEQTSWTTPDASSTVSELSETATSDILANITETLEISEISSTTTELLDASQFSSQVPEVASTDSEPLTSSTALETPTVVSLATDLTTLNLTEAATTPAALSTVGPCPYMYRGLNCDELCLIKDIIGTKDVVNAICDFRTWTVTLNPNSPYPIIDCWEICAWNDTCYGVTYDMQMSTCYLTSVDIDTTQCVEKSSTYFVYYSFKCLAMALDG